MFNALSANTRGAIFMMLAMAGYVLNDTLMKVVASDATIFQAIFVRGVFITTAIGFLVWQRGLSLNPLTYFNRMVWFRVFAELIGTIFFLLALIRLPIANISAILQVTPLVLTLATALFLGEQVGWRRYSAIILGFIGVMLIIKPGTDAFNSFSLLALAAMGLVVIRDLSTRQVPAHIPSLILAYLTALMITLMGGVVSLFRPWPAISSETIGLLGIAASFLFVGYLFSIMTMRVGDVGFIAPFRYTLLIWAILLGIFVFGDIPDALTLLGCVIVAGTGIYSLYRERKVRQL